MVRRLVRARRRQADQELRSGEQGEKLAERFRRKVEAELMTGTYNAHDKNRWPDWWRALLMMAYMTGWRISELLALRRDDLDLDDGYAVTRAEDNKGNRDERVRLHPVVVEHLVKRNAFTPLVFWWPKNRNALDREFRRIQKAVGIELPCFGKHEHTPACHAYGFHDLRRAFATRNAPRLSADALQTFTRHKSYAATQRYINMASQLDEAVDKLHVPNVARRNPLNAHDRLYGWSMDGQGVAVVVSPKAPPGFEPGMTDLQSVAFPLG